MSTKKDVKEPYDFDKATTALLIEKTKQRPDLWNIEFKQYINKTILTKFTDITDELNKLLGNPGITCEHVCRHIKWLQTQYVKEQEKVTNSKSSGVEVGNIYKPSFWCFDQLQFLNKSSEVKKEENEEEATTSTASDPGRIVDELKPQIDANVSSGETSRPSTVTTTTSTSRKRRASKVRTVAANAPKAKQPKTSDDCDKFGQWVAAELKKFEDQQLIINLKKSILNLIAKKQKNAI